MNRKEITIRENAKKIRAEILSDAIDIENILTWAIGNLYTQSGSADRLINDVVIDLTFAKKINIVAKFVKEYPAFFSKRLTIIRDLNEVREKRNIIAHRSLSIPWMWENDGLDEYDLIYLTDELKGWETKCDFKKGDKKTSFTVKDLENFSSFCSEIYNVIYEGVVSILNSRPKKTIAFDVPDLE